MREEETRILPRSGGNDFGCRLLLVGLMRFQESNGAVGPEEMRQMQLRRGCLVPGDGLEPCTIRFRIFPSEERREAVVAAQVEDARLGLFIGRRDRPIRCNLQLLCEIAIAVFATMLAHHAQPGRASELEESGGAAAARLRFAVKAALDTRLRDEKFVADAGLAR